MRKPTELDIFIGRQLQSKRKIHALPQEILGNKVGVTFQQIQKYERGTNRVSAGRLYEFSKILGFSLDEFFADLDDQPSADMLAAKQKHDRIACELDQTARRLAIVLLNISHEGLRTKAIKSLQDLVKTFRSCDGFITQAHSEKNDKASNESTSNGV